jgi:TfoX N-terminal domain
MAYNEGLAQRIREKLQGQSKIEEKKMMGGLCFLLKGKMCCGIVNDDLMVRVIESRYEEALAHPNGREMDFTGRPLKGFVFVDPPGFKAEKNLTYWLDMGVEFVQHLLPEKFKKAKKKKGTPKKTKTVRKKTSVRKKR